MKRRTPPIPRTHLVEWTSDGLASVDGRFKLEKTRGGWLLRDARPSGLIKDQWVRRLVDGQHRAEEILANEQQ